MAGDFDGQIDYLAQCLEFDFAVKDTESVAWEGVELKLVEANMVRTLDAKINPDKEQHWFEEDIQDKEYLVVVEEDIAEEDKQDNDGDIGSCYETIPFLSMSNLMADGLEHNWKEQRILEQAYQPFLQVKQI